MPREVLLTEEPKSKHKKLGTPIKTERAIYEEIFHQTESDLYSITREDMDILIKGLKKKEFADECASSLSNITLGDIGLFQRKDIDALIEAISGPEPLDSCAYALMNIAAERSDLFQRKDLEQFLQSLTNLELAFPCAKTLEYLAKMKPKLFKRKDLDALFNGLANEKSSYGCAKTLFNISLNEPKYAGLCIAALINGTEDKKSADACADALAEFILSGSKYADNCMTNLMAGLEKEESAEACANALATITKKGSGFSEISFNALINGIYKKESSDACATALASIVSTGTKYSELALNGLIDGIVSPGADACSEELLSFISENPEVFEKRHVDALMKLLSNELTRSRISNILAHIALKKPELFSQKDIEFMIKKLSNEQNFHFYLSILGCLVSSSGGLDEKYYKEILNNLELPIPEVEFYKLAPDSKKDKLRALFALRISALIIRDGANAEDIKSAFSFAKNHAKEFFTLWEQCGIRYFSRYSEELLVEAALNVQDPKRKNDAPAALLMYNQSDYNGAFYQDKGKLDKIMHNGYRVVLYEIDNEQGFFDKLVEEGSQRPIDVLWIAGHGEQDKIRLGLGEDEKAFLDVTDEDIIQAIIQYVQNDCRVVFNSCSTGKEEEGAKPSEWKSIAGIFTRTAAENGKTIRPFAPPKPESIFNLEFKKGILEKVIFFESEATQFSITPSDLP
ncbi:hypothetical protein KJ780_03185 [Candidatus Micrarchaeota archaeon]|nr:hypothetical protein [Candidatus Micrarchaeota archaeon]